MCNRSRRTNPDSSTILIGDEDEGFSWIGARRVVAQSVTLPDVRRWGRSTANTVGDDPLYAGSGDDFITATDGQDVIYAGAGNACTV